MSKIKSATVCNSYLLNIMILCEQMVDEMEKMLKEVLELEKALLEKTNSVKLAETRLENRMFRPGPELVQDEAQYGLADEVLQLRQTRKDLIKKIEDAK